MENNYEYTHLIDTQEQCVEDTDAEKEELFEDTNDTFHTEEELEHIRPDLNYNFHLQQWTQVSWKFIIMIQKLSLMIQNIFANIEANS